MGKFRDLMQATMKYTIYQNEMEEDEEAVTLDLTILNEPIIYRLFT